jgi:hypothetical protein
MKSVRILPAYTTKISRVLPVMLLFMFASLLLSLSVVVLLIKVVMSLF